MAKTVLGLFDSRVNAQDVITVLQAEGYNPKDISIVMRDMQEGQEVADSTGARVAGGAVTGASTGGMLGALAGLLVGTGVIPGLGAFLIGGPLAVALGLTGVAATTISGAATGALAGGILGALMGLGIPEEDARVYEERLKEGAILLAIPARPGDELHVKEILEEGDATDIKTLDTSFQREMGDVAFTESTTPQHIYAGAKGGTSSRSRKVTRRRKTS